MQRKLTVRSLTNQRENNEDGFLIFSLTVLPEHSPITVLAVADGMGGYAHGEHASREALKKASLALFEQLVVEPSINRLEEPTPLDKKTLSDALMSALEQANAHVRRMVEANKWEKAGSTIAIAMAMENIAVAANLGDSPLFHYQVGGNRLIKITDDHTIAGALLRGGMITEEMAKHHEGRGVLELYLGAANLPAEAPLHEIALEQGDLLLLCSDGISGSVSQNQIADIIAESSGDLEKIADSLIKASSDVGETDNQTLILWRCVCCNIIEIVISSL